MQLSSTTVRKKGKKSREGQSFYLFGFFSSHRCIVLTSSREIIWSCSWQMEVTTKTWWWKLRKILQIDSQALVWNNTFPLLVNSHFLFPSIEVFVCKGKSLVSCLISVNWSWLLLHWQQLTMTWQHSFMFDLRETWDMWKKKRHLENLSHLSKQLKLTLKC